VVLEFRSTSNEELKNPYCGSWSATAGKEQVEAIIKQELGHIVDLTKQLEALKK